jgi:hypothetical protein
MITKPDSCATCRHVAVDPYRLLSGRMVCQTCPRASEERGTRLRHVDNLLRLGSLDARRAHLDKIAAEEGQAVAADARVALALAWDPAKERRKGRQ